MMMYKLIFHFGLNGVEELPVYCVHDKVSVAAK